jgi:signal transduction histidine kinase
MSACSIRRLPRIWGRPERRKANLTTGFTACYFPCSSKKQQKSLLTPLWQVHPPRQVWTQGEREGIDLGVLIEPAARAGSRGDPTRLRQILLNFLGNAIEFPDQGSVSLRHSREKGLIHFPDGWEDAAKNAVPGRPATLTVPASH